jgi:hypothetical protein
MWRVLPGLALAASLAAEAGAQVDVEVDVELVLAVDVSRSVTEHELEIQRRGYAEAIASMEVREAIANGPNGRIALTYVEWAGSGSQRTVVPWTVIGSDDEARAFADRVKAHFEPGMRRTSISGAIDHAAGLFDENGFEGLRQIIDVSGDGPNNEGRPVTEARDDALARGIVINGLPLMTREGMGAQWHLPDLDRYYIECVIGGPAAFVVPVTDWSEFAGAVRRKLVLELVDRPVPITSAQYLPETGRPYDCVVGEKIWRNLYEFN